MGHLQPSMSHKISVPLSQKGATILRGGKILTAANVLARQYGLKSWLVQADFAQGDHLQKVTVHGNLQGKPIPKNPTSLFLELLAQKKLKVLFTVNQDLYFVIEDISALAPTHVLVIPYEHQVVAAELSVEQLDSAWVAALEAAHKLKLEKWQLEINCYPPLQHVFHLHLHLRSQAVSPFLGRPTPKLI